MDNDIIKNCGLVSLSEFEMKNDNGGIRVMAAGKWAGALILAGLASELIFNGPKECWQNFKDGFNSVDWGYK